MEITSPAVPAPRAAAERAPASRAPVRQARQAADAWQPTRALGHVLVLAFLCLATVIAVVLVSFGGWEYYQAPLATRGYLPQHAWLRPSGPVGLALGVTGLVAMFSTLPYAIRKRSKRLSRVGTAKGWLEAHIFFGVVGPILVTLHTSFKFNGLISAGYWLMMTVWASGFVGRYLYVRVPKTIRGVELSKSEVERRIEQLRDEIDAVPLPPAVAHELAAFHDATAPPDGGVPGVVDLFTGELRVRLRLLLLRRQLRSAGADLRAIQTLVNTAIERATLRRRIAHLQRTKRLLDLWHVFHQPLVYVMFLIVAMHVGIALYLGYAEIGL